ncbi:MAG TPA: hypothetical protein VK338_04000, partial [Candidatus Nitrosocosmicus sp.]|nr:hypothetical protein [Candidatus Nitrosocosmicus sp.]
LMNNEQINLIDFQRIIWDYYKKHKRDLPWRNTTDPYKILISEMMLQQTQVTRVITKYKEFLDPFPNFQSLANASLQEILRVWQGMGYNRRAKYIKAISEKVMNEYRGILPNDPNILVTFPGIGKNTAASIVAFSFNKPTVFIETNIRRVYIHYFFKDSDGIEDKDILKLVEKTLDKVNPRDWYYALMDYGTYLAKTVENPNKKSKHYTIQSKFEGSNRQIRGAILKHLLLSQMTEKDLVKVLNKDQCNVVDILHTLRKEGFVKEEQGIYTINN